MSTHLLSTRSTRNSDRGTYIYISVFSAVLYTVLLTAPVVAGKLIEQYSLSPSQVGFIFSAELGAFSLATVPAYLWLRKVNLRIATYFFATIVILGNLISGFLDSFTMLVAARVVTSLAAGSITVIILSLSGKTSNPGRAFGLFVVFQLAMGALILAVFPTIYANSEVSAIYWTLAGLTVLCLPVVSQISGEVLRSASAISDAHAPKAPLPVLLTGLAAVLLFYIALSGIWSFMAQISETAGIGLSSTSTILALATVAGIVSALLATVLGDTPRRAWYLRVGYLGMILSVALLFGTPGVIQFTIAAIVFKFAWTLILPYLLSTISDFGGSQVMNSTNLMIGAGFSIGPILSGYLIEASGLGAMVAFSLFAITASLLCVLVIQRHRMPARTATISVETSHSRL